MMAKPVAAVYDRRRTNEPTLTERRYRAVCDRPTTMARFSVAAVYDRRMENEPGAHRAPLQVVAAVYDRRASPALTERRYRKMSLWIICLLLCLPQLLVAAPKKNATPPVDPTVVYDTTVKVLRGGTCEVRLRAISPQGYDVEFKTITESGPRAGSLSAQQRISKSSVSYFYTHNGKKISSSDSFRFKAQSGPQKAWGYAKATILIEEPPPRFDADVSALDFGSVFLGKNSTKAVLIKNAGAGLLRGQLKVSAPWSLASPGEISLSEGARKKILVTFAPLSTDTQRGSLVFDSGTKPLPEIILEGVGESRFEAPDKAAFQERVGASQLCIPVKNRTAEPLSLLIHCPLPLEAPHAITLPPDSTGELLLQLPSRSFAEKSVLVTISDKAATHDILVSLPPSPSRLEWVIEGGKQIGTKSPARIETFSAKLLNAGSATANAVLRFEGEGIALAPDQPSTLTIAPGQALTVNAIWKLPDTPGQFEVSLVAETDGLPPVKTSWEANVQLPPPPPPPLLPPITGDHPPDGPTICDPSTLKLLASDISYQLEPHWSSCTAILSWQYSGPEPVEFFIVRPEVRRKNLLDKNPFEKTIPLPTSVPTSVPKILWVPIDSKKANITKLPDGRWQGRVPGLPPGYHAIGIISKVAGEEREGFVEFPVSIGKIPQPDFVSWSMFAIVLICAGYLLRKKIRSLFE